ncbi:MAG: hypothetical protein VX899_24480 [Myxococcota bacterium]|nr:hypothetical protein [Myxococcota bacterium]
MDEFAKMGTHDLDCVEFQISVLGGTVPLDLSGLTRPELVETGDCGVGLTADWLSPDAWKRGVVVELQVGAQIWFFTNRSVMAWPETGGSVAVRVIGPDGAAVEFEELGEWECVHAVGQ